MSGDEFASAEHRARQAAEAEHATFAFDDAAYLLGALDADEQAQFERHLLGCARCQDALAELSALPTLLGTVSIGELTDLDDAAALRPPDTLLAGLLAQVAATRRHRAWRATAIGFAVACVLALVVGLGDHLWSDQHRAQPLAMVSVGPNHGDVRATVTLTGSDSAVRIRLDCGYRSGGSAPYPATAAPSYTMVVVNRLGQLRELGSWTAQSGEDVELSRDSPWSRRNLSRIEVTDAAGVTVLQLSL
ncbi:MAG: zf-HC2 domain-containing protein [Jatrophihabitantaceae bacterium]